MNEHEVLVAARNLIDREGWIQGEFARPDGGYCAVGAVLVVTGHTSLQAQSSELGLGVALTAVDALGFAPDFVVKGGEKYAMCNGVALWNNAPGRTKAEVLAAFDRAIAATAPPPADPLDGTLVAELEVVA